MLVASGQAAETYAIQNIVEAGGHVVASPRLYGGTYNLLHYTLPKFGIETTFVENPDDPESWQAAVRPNTRAFYGETISNPKIEILDISAVAEVAHRNGVPSSSTTRWPRRTCSTCWRTVPTSSCTPPPSGSAVTALPSAESSSTAASFDWTSQRDGEDLFPGFTQPDPSYGGVKFVDLGAPAHALKARVQLLRDTGAAISPFNAFLIAQGIETLSLRVQRHVENTQKVAAYLVDHPQVTDVYYAGLDSSPYHELAGVAPEGHRLGHQLLSSTAVSMQASGSSMH